MFLKMRKNLQMQLPKKQVKLVQLFRTCINRTNEYIAQHPDLFSKSVRSVCLWLVLIEVLTFFKRRKIELVKNSKRKMIIYGGGWFVQNWCELINSLISELNNPKVIFDLESTELFTLMNYLIALREMAITDYKGFFKVVKNESRSIKENDPKIENQIKLLLREL